MHKKDKKNWDYRSAGVDIDAGSNLVARISTLADSTRRPGVIGGLGGFGAVFDLSVLEYRQPMLVSTTDGVGTKIKLAIAQGKHDSIGVDLVAMCVNDLVVQGAAPLFFLDYFATGRLDVAIAEAVIQGISTGCQQSGCSLVGGETAEMPSMYADGDYDLAGFCVGVVEKEERIDGAAVRPGDVLVALASSGCHANGYSLIRALLDTAPDRYNHTLDGRPVCTHLLEPTRIYVPTILDLLQQQLKINAIAHITGGGLVENIPRVLPDNTMALIDTASWEMPPIFSWLMGLGGIDLQEMYRTFNCGVGMVLCVAEADAGRAIGLLTAQGEVAWRLGTVGLRDHAHTPMVTFL